MRDDSGKTWSRRPVKNFKKGLRGHSRFNDPTYLGFLLLFDWNTPLEHSYNGGSPLLAGAINENMQGSNPESWSTKKDTAMDYLRACGEFNRMKYLNAFINTLKSVNLNMPWYWQELEGLENAWKYNNMADPYMGGEDSKITIKCLESIDLRISRIMDLYRKACYDLKNRRIIIPDNLRKFQVSIFVQEIRKFQLDKLFFQRALDIVNVPGANVISQTGPAQNAAKALEKRPDINPNSDGNIINNIFQNNDNDSLRMINEASAKVIFKLEFCEFLPDESSNHLTDLKMNSPDIADQQIVFTYENLKEESEYPFIDTIVEDQTGTSGNNAGDEALQNLKAAGMNMLENSAISAIEKAKGKLNSLILGNVHGFSAGSIENALQQGTIQGLSSEIGQSINGLPGDTNIHESNNQIT